MKILQAIIQSISIDAILRMGFTLFIIVYISMGNLSYYIDCLEGYKIELAEEKDIDSEEKEGKEEIEREEFMNKQFSFEALNHQIMHSIYTNSLILKQKYGEIPTPPPKSII